MDKEKESHKLIRIVTPQECPWLDRTFEIGETVHRYLGYNYKLIGKRGSAFSVEKGVPPFFELPNDAVNFRAVI